MEIDKLDIIKEALKRFDDCQANSSEIRSEMIDDLDFLSGNQWDADMKKDRENDQRPCLVVNRLPTYINQVVNQARQNPPQLKVRPFDDSSDKDTAEVINGIERHIRNNSNSKAATIWAYTCAVRCGLGWFRILTDYCDDNSFEQEIKYARIKNPLSVYAPLHLCKEPDFSDMPYCFIIDSIPKEDYLERYPETNFADFPSTSTSTKWLTEDSVTIAEYFKIDYGPEYTVYQLGDGSIVKELPEGVEAVKQRKIRDKVVRWYKLSAVEVLEETTFPGKYIPVIPVLGDELNIDGEDKYISLTRFAKDPQREINYFKSNKTERIALAPKAPYIAAAGQVEHYKDMWENANRKNYSVLPYDPITVAGTLVGAPQRQSSVQTDAGIIEAEREAVDDLKAVTGIFDASLGNQGNETSGKAINARAMQGEVANFHYVDNFGYSIKHAGRITVDIIPEIYDTPRVMRILGEDMAEKIVKVNQTYLDESGKERLYDLKAGKYDVVVDVGPSYATKRQEAAENLSEIARSVPAFGEFASDMLVKNLDFPGADDLTDRLRKAIEIKYPALFEKEDDQQNTQALQAQLMQAQQQLQQLDQVIQAMSAELEQANAKVQGKESDNQTRLLIAQMQTQSNEKIAALQAEIKLISEKMKSNLTENNHAHDVGMEAMRHAHNMENKEIDHEQMKDQAAVSATNTENNNQME